MKLDCPMEMDRIHARPLREVWRRLPRRMRPILPATMLFLVAFGLFAVPSDLHAQYGRAPVDNGGLGLLPIGDQFPIKNQFLIFTPEAILPLPAAKLDITYQFSETNTIVNTQYNPQNGSPQITQAQVNAGLTAANFPATGYGAYIKAETERHLFRVRYGLGGGLEVGLDQAWVSFSGTGITSTLDEDIEQATGNENPERFSVSRTQFHYYLYHNGTALIATSTPADLVPQDPVFSLKWNLSEGGEVLPAVSIRLAYKSALDSATSYPRKLVSSGHDDTGYMVMFSKAVGSFVGHIQVGETELGGTGGNYVSTLQHQFVGLEYRINSRHSFILQDSSELSVLKVGNVSATSSDFKISRPADMGTFGYKFAGERFHMDLGWSEDFNSTDNTTDSLIFLDLGWQW